MSFWSAIYKRSFLRKNKIIFPPHLITAEDSVFICKAVVLASKIEWAEEESFYHYIRREVSLDATALSDKQIISKCISCEMRAEILNANVKLISKEIYCAHYFANLHYLLFNVIHRNHKIRLKKRVVQCSIDCFKKRQYPEPQQYVYDTSGFLECGDVDGLFKHLTSFSNKARQHLTNECPGLVVCLTSYPARISLVGRTIETLLKQTLKADRIVLYLAKSQFPHGFEDLPTDLLCLCDVGLSISWCDDLKSYKKLIPALTEFPHSTIVTFDDDNLYDTEVLERLYQTHCNYPDEIIASAVRRIDFDSFKMRNYQDFEVGKYFSKPSFLNIPLGVGGVLYPPKIFSTFHNQLTNVELFFNIAPFQSCVWFWTMAVLNGIRIKHCDDFTFKSQIVPYINDAGMSLSLENIQSANNIVFKNLFNIYPELSRKIIWEYYSAQFKKMIWGERLGKVISFDNGNDSFCFFGLKFKRRNKHQDLINQVSEFNNLLSETAWHEREQERILQQIREQDAICKNHLLEVASSASAFSRQYLDVLSDVDNIAKPRKEVLIKKRVVNDLSSKRNKNKKDKKKNKKILKLEKLKPLPYIPILFAANTAYYQHLCVLLVSILENNRDSNFDFRVLTDSFDAAGQRMFEMLAQQYKNFCLKFTIISKQEKEALSLFRALGNSSELSYYRLLIPKIATDLDKCIYLDSDIICNGPLKELWETDIKNHYLAAVNDKSSNVLNAGVILFNLKAIRDDKKDKATFQEMFKALSIHTLSAHEVISNVLGGRCKSLSSKWNYTSEYSWSAKDILPVLIHYNGSGKAWLPEKNCNHRLAFLYFNYLKISPYSAILNELGCLVSGMSSSTENHLRLILNDGICRTTKGNVKYDKEDLEECPKISVIIPIHNSEKYLRECLDSIRNQTFNNFEVICVDDDSQDASLKVLLKFKAQDNRFVIVRQPEHSGAASARNAGLKAAKGKYLFFLDSDDLFYPTMFSEMYNTAEEKEADVVICGATIFNNHDSEMPKGNRDYLNLRDVIGQEVFSYSLIEAELFKITTTSVGNKLYRKDFILKQNFEFQNLPACNDAYFSIITLIFAQRIAAVEKQFAFFRVGHENSISSYRGKYPDSILNAYLEIEKTVLNREPKIADKILNDLLDNFIYVIFHEFKQTDIAGRKLLLGLARKIIKSDLHYEKFAQLCNDFNSSPETINNQILPLNRLSRLRHKFSIFNKLPLLNRKKDFSFIITKQEQAILDVLNESRKRSHELSEMKRELDEFNSKIIARAEQMFAHNKSQESKRKFDVSDITDTVYNGLNNFKICGE